MITTESFCRPARATERHQPLSICDVCSSGHPFCALAIISGFGRQSVKVAPKRPEGLWRFPQKKASADTGSGVAET